MKNWILFFMCVTCLRQPVISQEGQAGTSVEKICSFVRWYGENWEKLSKLESNIIDAGALKLKENEESAPYSVNFDEVEKYINELTNTGFFSEDYLTAQRQQFGEIASNFKKNPQNEGPPEGFQYDRFFLTQEDFLQDIVNIDGITLSESKLTENATTVYMHFPVCDQTYCYRLSIKEGKWQIDSISDIICADIPHTQKPKKQ
ncbi:MAG: amino terminal protease family protein [Sphingobacterium sp.]|jgi:hypothetical protein|nr:amino terminal protease family protein [Sphingobacterium sp.]